MKTVNDEELRQRQTDGHTWRKRSMTRSSEFRLPVPPEYKFTFGLGVSDVCLPSMLRHVLDRYRSHAKIRPA